ncbi:MAG: DUF169 domain-containing protein [Deferribacterota bacterium]|nr:DUF169 domain-containing protein [Deferribacterota bacterium]
MEYKLKDYLKLDYDAVALAFTNNKLEKAISFKEGKYACVMYLFASAAKGKIAQVSRKTFGCWGGAVGLGFGNYYKEFPGGLDCFYSFLSKGNKESKKGRALLKNLEGKISEPLYEKFANGERLKEDPELVKNFVEKDLPITDIDYKFVTFKPLSLTEKDENIGSVSFIVNADQLSALIILSNYFRDGLNNVIAPQAAACQQIGILTYNEGKSENPKAVIGLTDISARLNLKHSLKGQYLTVSMPYKLFLTLEEHAEDSFLTAPTWKNLISN